MASVIKVDVDKRGVDPALKETANNVREIGKASKEASSQTKSSQREIEQAASKAAGSASRQTLAWVEATRAVDDFATVLANGGSLGSALRASANNLSTLATAINPTVGVITALSVNIGSVLLDSLLESEEATGEFRSTLSAVTDFIKESAVEDFRELASSISEVADEAFGGKDALFELADAMTPGDLDFGLKFVKGAKAAAEAVKAVQERADLAREALDKLNNRDSEEQIKREVERFNSIQAVNDALKEQKRILEESAESGSLSEDETRDAITRMEALSRRSRELVEESSREAEKEVKEILKEREKALKEAAQEEERLIDGIARKAIRAIQDRRRAEQQAAREKQREQERLEREEQQRREEAARELLEQDGIEAELSGENVSQEDIAREVARRRGEQAGRDFDAEADRLAREGRDPARNESDLRRRRERAVSDAEQRGFRDTLSGRASDEEINEARRENVRQNVDALAKNNNVSRQAVEGLKEATTQIQEQQRESERQASDLAEINRSLKAGGQAARRRRSQRNGSRQ